jgi:lysozyme
MMMQMNRLERLMEAAHRQLRQDEGFKLRPYKDEYGNLTIGIGHNLSSKPLSVGVVNQIFQDDFNDALSDCLRMFGDAWDTFPDLVRLACINLMFNMGFASFSQFERTRALLVAGNYKEASKNLLDTKWARDVKGQRATRVTQLMQGRDLYLCTADEGE